MPIDLDHRPGGRVHQIDGQEQVRARGRQHRDVAAQAGADRGEHRERRVTGATSAGSRRAFATRSRPTWPCSLSQSNDRLSSAMPSCAAASANAACVSFGATGGMLVGGIVPAGAAAGMM